MPAAVLALALGGALGVGALSLVTSTEVGAFIASIQVTIQRDPALLVGVTLVIVLGPLLIGLVLGRRTA